MNTLIETISYKITEFLYFMVYYSVEIFISYVLLSMVILGVLFLIKGKNKIIPIITLMCAVLAIVAILNFQKNHSITYQFDDSLIIGHHIDEIQERYGKFRHYPDSVGDYGFYEINDRHHENDIYIMYYDEDGIVYKIEEHGMRGG